MHGPNVIRRFPGADAPALRAHQHPAPRQYHQLKPILSPGAPNDPALVRQHRSRPPRARPDGLSRSPGGQPAPGTPRCTSYACPTYGQPSRRTSGPTSQVSTARGQSHKAAALAAAGCAAALALAGPASAEKYNRHFAQDCPQPYSQNCSPQPSVNAATNGPSFVPFTADGNPPP